jgi:glycoprotein endo-alpha-1,2-mannosidase
VARHYPAGGSFSPPNNLHCPFYPHLGPYSSSNPQVISQHMKELRDAGVNVLVVSWWGPHWRKGTHDTQVSACPPHRLSMAPLSC